MPAVPAMPGLSKILAWDTQHLVDAAARWDNSARVWDDAFSTVARQVGVPWKGQAAEAAMRQAAMDRVKVVAIADNLRNAAGVARRGAGQLDQVKQTVLSAVARAREDGFEVAEDLSVSDPDFFSSSAAARAAREALAQSHANQIGTKALELVALDQNVATGITDAAGDVGEISFEDAHSDSPSGEEANQTGEDGSSTEGPTQPPTSESGSSDAEEDEPAPEPLPFPVPTSADGYTPITAEQLREIVPEMSQSRAEEIVGPLNQAMREGGINTPLRQAAFISQLAVESDRFRTFEEYADGSQYEGRKDLGNTQPGDGMKYKGRGAIQVTGRYNYTQMSEDLGVDFVNNPELAATPEYAFKTAEWYWSSRDGNAVADRGDIREITRMVNGGHTHLAERTEYYNRGLEVLSR